MAFALAANRRGWPCARRSYPCQGSRGVLIPGSSEPASRVSGPSTLRLPTSIGTHKRASYERLRDLLITFELPPGARLVEAQLARRLGVSKTPVREALALLETDGLVRSVPYRGAVATWLSQNELTEQGYLLDALEVPAYPIVVERITEAELRVLRRDTGRPEARTPDERCHPLRSAPGRDPGGPAPLHRLAPARISGPPGHGPIGLRYDHALVYPFDDAWDLLLEMSVVRHEAIRKRDAQAAQLEVGRRRQVLHVLNLERVRLPAVARYFREPWAESSTSIGEPDD